MNTEKANIIIIFNVIFFLLNHFPFEIHFYSWVLHYQESEQIISEKYVSNNGPMKRGTQRIVIAKDLRKETKFERGAFTM